MGFYSLQHMPASKVHFSRVCPPASFRLQGLVTLLAVCALRGLAGFISHRQRSWDSPFGGFASQKVSDLLPAGTTHIPSGPSGIPAAEAPDRPERPRFLGLIPSESPWQPRGGLARWPLVPPLGFALPGCSREYLGRDFARPPLARFTSVKVTYPHTHRRPRVSISIRLA
jgi:hypothetical protein